ncbi:UTRA domain-containing protein [Gemmobacter denitrificans]|uniref:UTRA domain-containing protein n=1 Tax=Gemmobacter denitrificans TaxID=3123040 RepID=A0ABU8BSM7_9RHOB
MTDGRSATLHDRILTEVRDKILRGHWPAGHRIPIETEMATDYGVSRMTVNKVLTQLTREGYLERRRKGGTFVARPRGQSAVMAIPNIGDEVRARGAEHRFALVRHVRRKAGPGDPLPVGAEVLELEYLHRADDLPFCHEWRQINLAAVPAAAEVDFAVVSAGAWLQQQVPWSTAEHVIRAVAPPPSVARALGLSAGSACLEVERRTEFEDQPITFVRLIYPGTHHQLVARFSMQGQFAPG